MKTKMGKVLHRVPMRQVLGFFVCLLILSSVGLQPLAAQQESTSSSAERNPGPDDSNLMLGSQTAAQVSSQPDVRVKISRYGQNQVEFEVTFGVSSSTEELLISTSDAAVTDSRGFRYTSQEDSYRWDQQTNSPSITYVINIRNWEDTNSLGRDYASGSNWIFAPNPPIVVGWITDSRQYYSWLPFTNPERGSVTISTDGSGVVGERSLYLGPYTEHSQMIGEQNVRLIVSDEATLEDDPNEIVAALQDASQYMVGSIHSEILVFALPSPMREGGAASSQSGEFWVHESSRLDSPYNTWFHEYMHTRQTYETNESMDWFIEASAQYYAAVLTFEQDRISREQLLNHLSDDRYNGDVVANPDNWSDEQVPYIKGAKILFALEFEIYERTDGERSLGDVIYRMHQHEDTVSYQDFKSIVVDIAGPEMGQWLDRYITTSASPNIQDYTSSPATFTESPSTESDRVTTTRQTNSQPEPTAGNNDDDSEPGDDSSGSVLWNLLIGGVVGYWVWNDLGEEDHQIMSFIPGLFVCLVFWANLILGVIAISGYWYWTRRYKNGK